MTEFYLISAELGPERAYAPRACRVQRRLRNDVRDDLALVEIDPPIPKATYRTIGADEDITQLMLASRHEGTSLFPITRWPTAVYVCHLKFGKGEPIPDDVDANFAITDWGLVFPSSEEAAAEQRKSYGDNWQEESRSPQ